MSWNCRGLGIVPIVQEIEDLVSFNIPNVVFLMEVKVDRKAAEKVERRIRFKGVFHVSYVNNGGGWHCCGGTLLMLLFRVRRAGDLQDFVASWRVVSSVGKNHIIDLSICVGVLTSHGVLLVISMICLLVMRKLGEGRGLFCC